MFSNEYTYTKLSLDILNKTGVYPSGLVVNNLYPTNLIYFLEVGDRKQKENLGRNKIEKIKTTCIIGFLGISKFNNMYFYDKHN